MKALLSRPWNGAPNARGDESASTVTLTGPVHSWAERKSVLAAARYMPGVRAIEDHLRTEPV